MLNKFLSLIFPPTCVRCKRIINHGFLCYECNLEYEKEQIGIETNLGKIQIIGSGLNIKLMNRNRITISGDLHAVRLREDCNE